MDDEPEDVHIVVITNGTMIASPVFGPSMKGSVEDRCDCHDG